MKTRVNLKMMSCLDKDTFFATISQYSQKKKRSILWIYFILIIAGFIVLFQSGNTTQVNTDTNVSMMAQKSLQQALIDDDMKVNDTESPILQITRIMANFAHRVSSVFENNLYVLFVLFFPTLWYLFCKTNKDEDQLFTTSHKELIEKYEAHYPDLIRILSNENDGSRYTAEAITDIMDSKNQVLTRSIYLIKPQYPSFTIDNLLFHNDNNHYALPWIIAASAKVKLEEKFYHQATNKSNYNGVTLRVKGIEKSADNITIKMENSFYFNYLVTNMMADVGIIHNTTVRDVLEPGMPGKRLNQLEETMVENHLGLSCLVICRNGESSKLLVGKRSQNVSVFRGKYSPSVSGAANAATCRREDDIKISPLNWLMNEMQEELMLPDVKNYIDYEEIAANALFLGMSRELIRLGKPEVFFAIELDEAYSKKFDLHVKCMNKIFAFKRRMKRETKKYKSIEEASQSLKSECIALSDHHDYKLHVEACIDKNFNSWQIDDNEHEEYLWLDYNVVPRQVRYEDNLKDFVIDHGDDSIHVLSESLWVNWIMYRKYMDEKKSKINGNAKP
ncbi:hypothetical protein LOH54_02900 [Sulfurimonas sp. HSL-3221]|uniref:hypothetical protein n=1 Tax=Thiomicrolovo sulfuroxydans TaxID=2894755 RepID=UPI001E2E0492|nr:hypothetical protein [Sulfurimonas sp. HSL-3221]UFS63082.1 hypothetical protein LOH54_02900 [Sulfurimonas sp. HSL-3221]